MTTKTVEHVSDLALAAQERKEKRPQERFELTGYFGPGERPVGGVLVQVPTKWEQDNAVDRARGYVKENLTDEDARKDPKVLQDAELCCLAWHCCRDEKNPKYPAFPSPAFMMKNMSAEEIGVLVNLVNGVRGRRAPMKWSLEPELLNRVVQAAADLSPTDIPDKILAGWNRDMVTSAFVVTCVRVVQQEAELEELRAYVARHREAVLAAGLPPVDDAPAEDADALAEPGTE